MNNYYDSKYFEYQKSQGLFASEAMKQFFQPYIKSSDTVIDFGCGGGYLLKKLDCSSKLGIEINASARESAHKIGITTVSSINEIDNDWADVLISNHALEHTQRPFDILVELKGKIRIGGTVVFIVPHETKYKYNPNDENKHLYTWSEMCIGNLFTEAGYEVVESKEIVHRFPPNHVLILKMFGWRFFNLSAIIYGYWARFRHMTQVRVIARRII